MKFRKIFKILLHIFEKFGKYFEIMRKIKKLSNNICKNEKIIEK